MTTELLYLTLSVLLGIVQIILASHSASFQRGYRWTAGRREEIMPPLVGWANIFRRALANYIETFPLFAAVVLAAHLAGVNGSLTEWGVHLYFWARLAYVPLYGISVVRSLVWNVATAGILLIVWKLLTSTI